MAVHVKREARCMERTPIMNERWKTYIRFKLKFSRDDIRSGKSRRRGRCRTSRGALVAGSVSGSTV